MDPPDPLNYMDHNHSWNSGEPAVTPYQRDQKVKGVLSDIKLFHRYRQWPAGRPLTEADLANYKAFSRSIRQNASPLEKAAAFRQWYWDDDAKRQATLRAVESGAINLRTGAPVKLPPPNQCETRTDAAKASLATVEDEIVRTTAELEVLEQFAARPSNPTIAPARTRPAESHYRAVTPYHPDHSASIATPLPARRSKHKSRTRSRQRQQWVLSPRRVGYNRYRDTVWR